MSPTGVSGSSSRHCKPNRLSPAFKGRLPLTRGTTLMTSDTMAAADGNTSHRWFRPQCRRWSATGRISPLAPFCAHLNPYATEGAHQQQRRRRVSRQRLFPIHTL
jgi:hypothetical protein